MGFLAYIPLKDKEILIKEYQLFQPYLAALYPKLDVLIVQALTATSQREILSFLYRQLLEGNDFDLILGCEDAVLASIKQSQAAVDLEYNV